jgi:hypothetical protein
MPFRLFRRVLLTSALTLAILTCLPSLARADITVYQETSLPRTDPQGKSVNKRALSLKPEGVSYQDCKDDLRIRFALQLSGFEAGGSLQVWAGLGECKTQTNRQGASATCWQIEKGIGLAVNTAVDIPVRAIMAGVSDPRTPNAEASVCGTVDLATVSLQFLYFAPGQLATPAQNKDISVEIDTIGPDAPTGIKTEPGNGRIRVRWDNISGEGGVSLLTGVKVYADEIGSAAIDAGASQPAEPNCTEVPNTPDAGEDGGDAGDIDAGTTIVCEDGGTSDGGGGGGGACESANLREGIIPDAEFNSHFECGSITGNAGSSALCQSADGKPLKNRDPNNPNVTYAVAVAATDPFGNVGKLSAPICEYPEETSDFWQNYRNSGGKAGGGCASAGSPIGSVSALTTITVAVLSMARRRWSKRRSESGARRNG